MEEIMPKQITKKNRVQDVHEHSFYQTIDRDVLDPQKIQFRAYMIHQEKGGDHVDNWLEAERLLKEEYQNAAVRS
jgi:hypothetical protein